MWPVQTAVYLLSQQSEGVLILVVMYLSVCFIVHSNTPFIASR